MLQIRQEWYGRWGSKMHYPIDEKTHKPYGMQPKKEMPLDLNRDGTVDGKDASLAGKVLKKVQKK